MVVLKLFYYSRWHQLCLHEWRWGNTKIHKSVIYKDNHRRNSNIQSKNTWDLWNAVHFFSTWIPFRLSQLKLEADRLFKTTFVSFVCFGMKENQFFLLFQNIKHLHSQMFHYTVFRFALINFFHRSFKGFFYGWKCWFFQRKLLFNLFCFTVDVFFVVDAFKSIKIALSFDIYCAEVCQVQGQICGKNIIIIL